MIEGGSMDFASTLRGIRLKSGMSRYRLAHWSGINESYIHRLESRERSGPSRDVVIMLSLALTRSECPVSGNMGGGRPSTFGRLRAVAATWTEHNQPQLVPAISFRIGGFSFEVWSVAELIGLHKRRLPLVQKPERRPLCE